ncbi:ClpP/crotonase [Pseudovirgaria hyperparasitica]|uniref:ClpP/crotonase n=1 Tax=Pseudovirgaria hyperparasitica TaxID=470096 RepID=A0A6A6WG12_9PEZI|nr:ClpP/crotonase [Pseudovirgaria hyperparasitica]KAF2760071.1 ClpP/crotonase [Pseudovirgaria hyperparasitica]
MMKHLFSLAASLGAIGASIVSQKSARGTLTFTYSPNITRVTISNPPINVFDANLASDLLEFLLSIQPSNTMPLSPPKVVILASADADFFIPHIDLLSILPPQTAAKTAFLDSCTQVTALLRNTTTTVFITEIDGRASGIGDEILLQTDLRFAGPGARLSQLETAVGVFPGGGGMKALPSQISRARALQYALTNEAVGGAKAADLGWVNGYFDSKETLRMGVDEVARKIALRPAGALEGAKRALPRLYPHEAEYEDDLKKFSDLAGSEETAALVKGYIELSENQTRGWFELGVPESLEELF